MAYRKAHGNAAKGGKLAVIETSPPDELPDGVPGESRPVATRDEQGRFLPGSGTAEAARLAGLAAGEARKLRRLLGLVDLPEDAPTLRYLHLATELRDEHAKELAGSVGGGRLSPGVMSVISSAALAFGASRYLYDQALQSGDPDMFGKAAGLAEKSRLSLLQAHEMAAREAQARPRRNEPPSWLKGDN
jgi:hypothetical protein